MENHSPHSSTRGLFVERGTFHCKDKPRLTFNQRLEDDHLRPRFWTNRVRRFFFVFFFCNALQRKRYRVEYE